MHEAYVMNVCSEFVKDICSSYNYLHVRVSVYVSVCLSVCLSVQHIPRSESYK